MAVTVDATRPAAIHPFHAVHLAGTFTLFLGVLLSDIAYWQTYQVQWTNFASWLIVGGLVFGGIALAAALFGLRHAALRRGRYLVYSLLLLATWVLGLINALVHAKDAWGAMPEGLVLSVIVAVLAAAATWLGFSSDLHRGDRP
ncbi:MAG: hypothetical protein M3Q40_05090 [Pseudomonadota bacterium]|nr:hypothetical protein [Pseudomonadota bacterium]